MKKIKIAKRIIDKNDPEFINCPDTSHGQVLIDYAYDSSNEFAGTITAEQEVVDEIVNDLTPNERKYLGWDEPDYAEAIASIKRDNVKLKKAAPDKKLWKDKTELHKAMREKGIEP